MFSVDVRQEARGTVLVLRGELDFDSAVQLDEAGEHAGVSGGAEGVGAVVVDLTALSFCDSSGISALLRLYRRLSARQQPLLLAAVPRPTLRLLTLTGLDRVFSIHPDVEAALGARPAAGPQAGPPTRTPADAAPGTGHGAGPGTITATVPAPDAGRPARQNEKETA